MQVSANQDQIVAMNDFRFVYVAEQVLFLGGFPGDQAGFAAAVVAQASSDFTAFRVDAGDDRAALEFTFGCQYANGQKTFPAF
jgi:hypothetical protein